MNITEKTTQQTIFSPYQQTVEPVRTLFSRKDHYYGDIVRILLLTGSILMILTLPFYFAHYSLSLIIALILIIAIVVLAGSTNPRQPWTALLDLSASLIGFCFFEYYVVTEYTNYSFDGFMLSSQIVAIIFIFALYFATKTIRGFSMR